MIPWGAEEYDDDEAERDAAKTRTRRILEQD